MEQKIKLYTIKELAKILRVSEATIRTWINEDKIVFTRLGGSVRFTEEQINEIITNGVKY